MGKNKICIKKSHLLFFLLFLIIGAIFLFYQKINNSTLLTNSQAVTHNEIYSRYLTSPNPDENGCYKFIGDYFCSVFCPLFLKGYSCVQVNNDTKKYCCPPIPTLTETPIPTRSPTPTSTPPPSPTSKPTPDISESWAVKDVNKINLIIGTKEFWTGEFDHEPVLVDQFDPKQYENINPALNVVGLDGIKNNACGAASAIDTYNAYFKLKYGVSPRLTIGDFINKFYGKKYIFTDGKSYSYFLPNGEMVMTSLMYAMKALDQNQDLYIIDRAENMPPPSDDSSAIYVPSFIMSLSFIEEQINQVPGTIGIGLGKKYSVGHISPFFDLVFNTKTQKLGATILDPRGNRYGHNMLFIQTNDFNSYWEEIPEKYGSDGIYAFFAVKSALSVK